MEPCRRKLKVLLIGFGNVGRQLAKILTRERDHFPGLSPLELKFVAIIGRSKGSLVNQDKGIDLHKALEEVENHGTFDPANPDRTDMTGLEAAASLDYDVLIELSTLSIENRGEPAISHIRTALARGSHAISANKGPVAFALKDLQDLAHMNNCSFLYETTVMDGAPVFKMARCSLKGCTIKGIDGILNSTTNYILTRMEEGQSLEGAVKEAQDIGVAEADPSHDLEGWDPAAKISVLANSLMGASITPYEVDRTGITHLKVEDVRQASISGKKLKLLCRAWREAGMVKASVKVEEIPALHHYASVTGGGAVIRIETDLMGPILITQEDPTLYDTAYGVLSDLMTLTCGY
ncbi:MAG: homoserine dehydrogenase [Synergistales bacterium]|nr:homoserine dehydrogenase [Synergistales bacterium]